MKKLQTTTPISLTHAQLEALRMAVLSRLSVLADRLDAPPGERPANALPKREQTDLRAVEQILQDVLEATL